MHRDGAYAPVLTLKWCAVATIGARGYRTVGEGTFPGVGCTRQRRPRVPRAPSARRKYRRCKELSDMLFGYQGAASLPQSDFALERSCRQVATIYLFAVSWLQPVGRMLGELGA